MMRGINRQIIFEDDGDRHYFMTVLKTCKEVSGFRLHAFCLMDNHVHLLIEPAEEPLGLVFQRIGDRYATWYNRKYRRTGHLFQNRYRSENVETDGYFMTVLRYILQNPMKAGLEPQPGSYRWSSYLAYEKGSGTLTDTQFATGLFGSREALVEFVRQTNEDEAMDEAGYEWLLRDDQALNIMRRISQCDSLADFQRLSPPVRKAFVQQMYLSRLSMSQISRLTGMPRTTVSRTVKKIEPEQLLSRQQLRLHEAAEFPFPEEVW